MQANILQLQPSERILSERKLARVRWMYDNGLYKPKIVVTPFEDKYTIVDGNHSTYVAYEKGLHEIEADVENREMQNVPSIISAGITNISDLSDKIVTHDEWRKRFTFCTNFEDELSDDDFFRKHPELEQYCSYR